MQRVRASIVEKERVVNEIINLLETYRNLIVIDAFGLRTKIINEMRENLRGRVKFKFVKPSLFLKAAEKKKSETLVKLAESYVRGSVLLAFSNEDPFKLVREFKKNAMLLPAKAGSILQEDLVIKPGNTGLPPGPMISELNEVGIPTRIDKGSIWITREVTVAKAGDKVSEKLAAVLSKLNIKPIKMYLRPKAAIVDNTIIDGQILETEPEEIIRALVEANKKHFVISVALNYPTKDNISFLLTRAAKEALALSLELKFLTKENLAIMLQIAHQKAKILESIIKQ